MAKSNPPRQHSRRPEWLMRPSSGRRPAGRPLNAARWFGIQLGEGGTFRNQGDAAPQPSEQKDPATKDLTRRVEHFHQTRRRRLVASDAKPDHLRKSEGDQWRLVWPASAQSRRTRSALRQGRKREELPNSSCADVCQRSELQTDKGQTIASAAPARTQGPGRDLKLAPQVVCRSRIADSLLCRAI